MIDPQDPEKEVINKSNKGMIRTTMWEVSSKKNHGWMRRESLSKFEKKVEKGVRRMAKEFRIPLESM